MDAKAREILEFWFGSLDGNQAQKAWFTKDAAFDAVIRQRFGLQIDQALAGGLHGWLETAHEGLAYILLLDQFTRNTGRDTAQAFAGDAQALAAARSLVTRQLDHKLTPVQRWFVYLPYEHSEDIVAQREGLQLFAVLAWQHPAQQDAFDWAVKHYDVIVRFGRYPHRNAALGRVDSTAEKAFLSQPGSRF
jgi:uncharacterized protein (DUF924 family)